MATVSHTIVGQLLGNRVRRGSLRVQQTNREGIEELLQGLLGWRRERRPSHESKQHIAIARPGTE